MSREFELTRFWITLKRLAFWLGGLGVIASLWGWSTDSEQFLQSYLMSWLFWTGLSLGGLTFLLLHHMVGSSWGVPIQRILEAASFGLIPLAALFLPVLFGLEHLYPWARPEEVAADEHLAHRTHYLNPAFFAIRYGIYFAVWIGLWLMVQRMTADVVSEHKLVSSKTLRMASAPALLFVVLTTTFASMDWGMSLEKDWISMIYGLIFLMSGVLGCHAFSLWVLSGLAVAEPLHSSVSTQRIHDLGNFLLTFVLVWAYFAFSQLLIIWYGNVPEDNPWLVRRIATDWNVLGLAVCLLHFFLPFLILLNRNVKQNVKTLGFVALGIFLMRPVENFWNLKPAFRPEGLSVHWMDLALFLGLGGIWMQAFLFQSKRRSLSPVTEEKLGEVEDHV